MLIFIPFKFNPLKLTIFQEKCAGFIKFEKQKRPCKNRASPKKFS
jgi:hypothetical protein